MERRPTRTQLRRQRLARRIVTTACFLVIGFSVGIIVTLEVVGFS
jgi:hypothetical protein